MNAPTALPVARQAVRQIADRVDAIDREIADRNADKALIYAEAKAEGYDVAALKWAIRRRRDLRAQPTLTRERAELADLYLEAIAEPEDEAADVRIGTWRFQITKADAEAYAMRAHAHVHAHEGTAHDPETGELIEDRAPEPASETFAATAGIGATAGGDVDVPADGAAEPPCKPAAVAVPSDRDHHIAGESAAPPPHQEPGPIDLTLPAFLDRRAAS